MPILPRRLVFVTLWPPSITGHGYRLSTCAMLRGSELMGGLAELEIDSASMYDFDN